jgi:MurNAc alpha-1-phosphate uridylyltransferase
MVFAAGFGTRMGALTAQRPKPLIPVAGRALIDRTLDLAAEAGCDPVVVNLHYLGQQIADHLTGRPVHLSWERDRILETGGGLRQALPLLGSGPVATLNPDAVWTGPNPLIRLADHWDPARMDGLLMVAPVEAVYPGGGRSDFAIDAQGRLSRHTNSGGPGFVYLGAQIIRTEGLAAIDAPVFSLNRLWDRMIADGRAFGLLHPGGWCDVGRPEGIAEAEALLAGADV